MPSSSTSSKAMRATVSTVAFLVFGLPLVWLLTTSFKTEAEFALSSLAFPTSPTLANYVLVLTKSDFVWFLGNSLLVSVVAVLLTLILAAPAAYAMSRLRFRGRGLVQLLFLFGIIVPIHITLLPLLKTLGSVGLADTRTGLSLVYAAFGVSLTVFMLRNAFDDCQSQTGAAAGP